DQEQNRGIEDSESTQRPDRGNQDACENRDEEENDCQVAESEAESLMWDRRHHSGPQAELTVHRYAVVGESPRFSGSAVESLPKEKDRSGYANRSRFATLGHFSLRETRAPRWPRSDGVVTLAVLQGTSGRNVIPCANGSSSP